MPHLAQRPEPDELPMVVARLLRAAQEAENHAIGLDRRPAFQLTRHLLGGARRAGYPVRVLAETLGISVASLRARASSDGPVPGARVMALVGLDDATLGRWAEDGRLAPTGDAGAYLASELVRLLADGPA
jgi:hypothetical protein